MGWKASLRQTFSAVKASDYAFSFFLAAQRAFINADNFFLAAALIAGRALVFLGADLPFHFAHRCFIAAEIRLRAAGDIVRRRVRPSIGAAYDLAGRPLGCLVGILEPAPSADVVDKNRPERRRSVRRDFRQQLLEGLSTANRNAASSGIFIAVRADKPMS